MSHIEQLDLKPGPAQASCGPWEAAVMVHWIPATHRGNLDWVLASWFWPGLVIEGIWGVYQQMGELALSPSVSQIHNNLNKQTNKPVLIEYSLLQRSTHKIWVCGYRLEAPSFNFSTRLRNAIKTLMQLPFKQWSALNQRSYCLIAHTYLNIRVWINQKLIEVSYFSFLVIVSYWSHC